MARGPQFTGASGVYLVAAQLSLREWPASVTMGNTDRTDLLAQVGGEKLPAAIQVKTKSEGAKDFHMGGISDRSPMGANEWVVLVGLQDSGDHDYFIVPRDHAWATVQATMPGNARGLIGRGQGDRRVHRRGLR